MGYGDKIRLGDSFDGDSSLSTSFIYSDIINSDANKTEISISVTGSSGDTDIVEIWQFNSISPSNGQFETIGKSIGTIDVNGDTEATKTFQTYVARNFKIGLKMESGSSETPSYKGTYSINSSLQSTYDSNVFHKEINGEIAVIPEKTSPVAADIVMGEDSENRNKKVRIKISNVGGAVEFTVDSDTNVRIVTGAGANITTGEDNFCAGDGAGDTIETGSNNICIGKDADVNVENKENYINLVNVFRYNTSGNQGRMQFYHETTVQKQKVFEINPKWSDDTDATRESITAFNVSDHGGNRTAMQLVADGTEVLISFFGETPQAQQNHIANADGTLADITTKFNTLLADLEGYGLLKSS